MPYSKMILASHAFVPSSEVDLERERDSLSYRSYFKDSNTCIPVYREVNGWFGYPLYGRIPQAREVSDLRTTGSNIKAQFKSTLRSDQQRVFSEFRSHIRNRQTGYLLNAKTGWGKTVFLLRSILYLNRTALVVVPKSDLILQWVEEIKRHTSLTDAQIGYVDGRRYKWRGCAIVVGLVHSLALDYLGKDFQNYFGQVWYDEIHASVPPDTFAPVASTLPCLIRGGVSATLKRRDGLHRVFEDLVGRTLLKGRDGKRKPIKTALVHVYRRPLPRVGGGPRKIVLSRILSALASCAERNIVIAYYADLIYHSGRRVCVISDRTLLLYFVAEYLKIGGVPQREIGYYCRSLETPVRSKTVSRDETERTKRSAKVILATYGMFGTGTDIPDLSAIIFATPRSEIEQAKGRPERWLEDKPDPILIDFWDTSYPMLTKWVRKRMLLYERSGAEVKLLEDDSYARKKYK